MRSVFFHILTFHSSLLQFFLVSWILSFTLSSVCLSVSLSLSLCVCACVSCIPYLGGKKPPHELAYKERYRVRNSPIPSIFKDRTPADSLTEIQ
jgi:hypothetical protein